MDLSTVKVDNQIVYYILSDYNEYCSGKIYFTAEKIIGKNESIKLHDSPFKPGYPERIVVVDIRRFDDNISTVEEMEALVSREVTLPSKVTEENKFFSITYVPTVSKVADCSFEEGEDSHKGFSRGKSYRVARAFLAIDWVVDTCFQLATTEKPVTEVEYEVEIDALPEHMQVWLKDYIARVQEE